MSVVASRWALDQLTDPECDLSMRARLALLALAAEANYRTGVATMGRNRLGAVFGIVDDGDRAREKAAWRVFRELRRWPHLVAVERAGKGIAWHFPVADVDHAERTADTPAAVHTGRADAAPAAVHTGRAGATTGRAHAAPPAAPTRPKGFRYSVGKGVAPDPCSCGQPVPPGKWRCATCQGIIDRAGVTHELIERYRNRAVM